ncbi:hypothetical protein J3459_016926 [Metarhizium acridum]|nr:hypothetical protein J3459_018517 [Metarhizium acridum]KAG8410835.1 hypothetical protein J3459_016926 [Metarhizium acridum]
MPTYGGFLAASLAKLALIAPFFAQQSIAGNVEARTVEVIATTYLDLGHCYNACTTKAWQEWQTPAHKSPPYATHTLPAKEGCVTTSTSTKHPECHTYFCQDFDCCQDFDILHRVLVFQYSIVFVQVYDEERNVYHQETVYVHKERVNNYERADVYKERVDNHERDVHKERTDFHEDMAYKKTTLFFQDFDYEERTNFDELVDLVSQRASVFNQDLDYEERTNFDELVDLVSQRASVFN